MRALRCRECGFLDGSIPTTAKDGNECYLCGSDNTDAVLLKEL